MSLLNALTFTFQLLGGHLAENLDEPEPMSRSTRDRGTESTVAHVYTL